MTTDHELFRRFENGSPDAFQALVRSWAPRLDALAWRFLGDVEEARDVRQTALLRLWTAPRAATGRRTTWLHRVVVNLCRDRLRSRRLRGRSDGGDVRIASADPAAADAAARDEVARRVAEAVASLPEAERDVVVLKQYADLSFARVAEILDIPATTAKSRMWRALAKLRVELKECAP
ncbi:MAG: RNA polymerase sigma-70 factor [Planctomycetes bacterium]|nr:RNA polymerase sigma-70 factor [Planctomycetota bacterium]